MSLKQKSVLALIVFGIISAYSQKSTTYYSNKKVRCVEVNKNKEKVLKSFFSTSGENLLTKPDFEYTDYDTLMEMTRTVNVVNKRILKEFWISGQDTIFNIIPYEPEFDIQTNQFIEYVKENLVYPKQAMMNKIQGRVKLSFIVEKDGTITEIETKTNLGYGLEQSAIELVKNYKNWGIINFNNRPVKLYLELPITFRLFM